MEVLGAVSWRFGSDSWRFGFMEVSRFGAPETPSPPAQAHPHSAAQFREPKRLRSFGKLLKHPTSKDNEGYMDQKLSGIVSIQTRQCPKCEIPELF